MLNRIDLSRVDLNLLVLFEAVFEERHVGRAGARLHLTPSAVSHGIGRLRRLFDDPVFLKHPKGVLPTSRATALAEPIADVLARVRGVVAATEAFDPRRSKRRFTIGAPDGIGAIALPPLLAAVAREAPGVDVAVHDVHPSEALAALDAGKIDLACCPVVDELPARFEGRLLYEEDFVIVASRGHKLGRRPTLERYCAARHLLVSRAGDSHGFMDEFLAERGLSRRVVLTVPSFFWALTIIAASDIVGTLPRSLMRQHGARFGVVALEPPVPFGVSSVRAVATRPALKDAGVAWLMQLVEREAGALADGDG